jgi:hypothetical protein
MRVPLNFQATLDLVISEQKEFIADFQEKMDYLSNDECTYLTVSQLADLTASSHRALAADRFLAAVTRYEQLNTGYATLLRVLDDTMVQLISGGADILTIQTFSLAQRAFQE